MIDKKIQLLLTLILCYQAQKCKVLVLEGGGDRGSYQAGVLSHLYNNLPLDQVDYDVISGVSVGSIGAMGLAQYAVGDEKAAVEWMVGMWRELTRSDIYVDWPEGPLLALFARQSIFDTRVMKQTFQKQFTTLPKRKLNIGTTNANTGDFVRFDEKSFTTLEDFISEVLCSSSMPGLFQYQNFNGTTYVDGGTEINLDIAGGVQRCMRDGFKQEDIIIDVILCNAAINIQEVPDDITVTKLYNKIQEINNFQGTLRDVRAAYASYPNVDYRYLFLPQSPLPWSLEPIFFIPSQIEAMIEQGKADAETIIQWGQGVSFKKYLDSDNSDN